MKYELDSFKGILPRVATHRKQKQVASVAHNVNLDDGYISSWRELKILEEAEHDITLYNFKCKNITFDSCVHIANLDYFRDRGVVVGHDPDGYAEYILLDENGNEVYYRLGVPTPTLSHFKVSDQVLKNRDRSMYPTNYVITYVNRFGEESAPSIATNDVVINDDEEIANTIVGTIDNYQSLVSDYGVIRINIYRLATPFRANDPKTQENKSAYFLVDTIQIAERFTHVDKKRLIHLTSVLDTLEVLPPPVGMQSIASIRGVNMLVGFKNNQVFFSDANKPYSWSLSSYMTFDFDIINMQSIDGHVFISTSSIPYVIVNAGSGNRTTIRHVQENSMESPLPDIACGRPSNSASTPFGMVYSSPEGLVLVDPSSNSKVLTKDTFNREQWRSIRPDTVRMAYWNGFLFCITESISFILRRDITTRHASGEDLLTTISDKPDDLEVTSAGELLFLIDGFIYQWNAGSKLRPYNWTSELLDSQVLSSFSAIKVGTTDTKVAILNSNDEVLFERKIVDNKPHRVRHFGRNRGIKIHFEGTGRVEYCYLATTIRETI